MIFDNDVSVLEMFGGDIDKVPWDFKMCWRQLDRKPFRMRCSKMVDPDDPVGLCERCKEAFR